MSEGNDSNSKPKRPQPKTEWKTYQNQYDRLAKCSKQGPEEKKNPANNRTNCNGPDPE